MTWRADVTWVLTWHGLTCWRDVTWRDVTWRDVLTWRDVTWRDGLTLRARRLRGGPLCHFHLVVCKIDFWAKVDLIKNEQVKWTCGWTCGYSLSACVFPFAFACAFSCASTCALLCIHLLRISHLRSTPGVFLKSPFTTFWNQLMENQQDSTPGLE